MTKLQQDSHLIIYDPKYSLHLENSQQLVKLGVMQNSLDQRPTLEGSQPHILFIAPVFNLAAAEVAKDTGIPYILIEAALARV